MRRITAKQVRDEILIGGRPCVHCTHRDLSTGLERKGKVYIGSYQSGFDGALVFDSTEEGVYAHIRLRDENDGETYELLI